MPPAPDPGPPGDGRRICTGTGPCATAPRRPSGRRRSPKSSPAPRPAPPATGTCMPLSPYFHSTACLSTPFTGKGGCFYIQYIYIETVRIARYAVPERSDCNGPCGAWPAAPAGGQFSLRERRGELRADALRRPRGTAASGGRPHCGRPGGLCCLTTSKQ